MSCRSSLAWEQQLKTIQCWLAWDQQPVLRQVRSHHSSLAYIHLKTLACFIYLQFQLWSFHFHQFENKQVHPLLLLFLMQKATVRCLLSFKIVPYYYFNVIIMLVWSSSKNAQYITRKQEGWKFSKQKMIGRRRKLKHSQQLYTFKFRLAPVEFRFLNFRWS